MRVGSVEYALIAFPGANFKGEILPAIQELVDADVVRVLDLALILKDEDGNVVGMEVSELPPQAQDAFGRLDYETSGLVSESDFVIFGEMLEPGSAAAILVWENTWMGKVVEAIMNADGVLVDRRHIPADVVAEAVAYAETVSPVD